MIIIIIIYYLLSRVSHIFLVGQCSVEHKWIHFSTKTYTALISQFSQKEVSHNQ